MTAISVGYLSPLVFSLFLFLGWAFRFYELTTLLFCFYEVVEERVLIYQKGGGPYRVLSESNCVVCSYLNTFVSVTS